MKGDQIIKQDVINVEEELLRAVSTSDVTLLEKLLHNGLLFITPDGNIVTKEMDLASHRAGTMVVEKVSASIEKISVIKDTAIVVVVYQTKGKMLDKLIEGKFRYIRVWKSFDGQLKVIGGSCFQVGQTLPPQELRTS